jgi:hypothetical protein
MDYDTFCRAVDSLEGYVGTVGIMGGEPTLHPEFERFAQYISKKYSNIERKENYFIYPQQDFIKTIILKEKAYTIDYDSGLGNRQTLIGPGLWSSAGPGYSKHYEIIQDTFLYQAYNDHLNKMYHQPVLITRKELGIDDEKWRILRDNCWIQNEWSASITPKGAFFCEIAASLDMLLNGPGGWQIEPGWWQRGVDDFADQLHWCEYCGIACDTFTRDANEEIDDISPVIYDKLKSINSPKLNKGKYKVIELENGIISEKSKATDKRFSTTMPYIEKYEDRFNSEKSSLYPKGFVNIVIFENENPASIESLDFEQFVKTYILCKHNDVYDMLKKKFEGNNKIDVIIAKQKPGVDLNKIIWGINDYYMVIHSGNVVISPSFCEVLKKCAINPGVLHYIDFSSPLSRDTKYISNAGIITEGFAIMLHKNAISLRKIGFDGIANLEDIHAIADKWEQNKVVELSSAMDFLHPETTINPSVKYAIYGTGKYGEAAYKRIIANSAQFVCAVDSSPDKWGKDFHGTAIQKPEFLSKNLNSFDFVLIASKYHYQEIRQRVLELGVSYDKVGLIS